MPVDLIVVGVGRWGRNHVTTAIHLGVLRSIVDSNSQALETIGQGNKETNVSFHTSLGDALKAHPACAVVIATPPTTHFALAKEALLDRRHVLIEKPFCVNLKDAVELVELAKKMGVIIMVNHLLQYNFPHQQLVSLVKDGCIGDVTRIRMSRMNFGTIRLEENVLWSFTPHDISIMLSLCGKLPKTVSCTGQCLVSKGIEDHIDMSLEFDNGISGRIEASWMHPLKERRTIVYGTKGSLILNEATANASQKTLQGFQWSAKRRADGTGVAIEKSEQDLKQRLEEAKVAAAQPLEDVTEKPPLHAALQHFLDCIKSGTSPRTDGKEALNVMNILEAASKSLAKGGEKIEMRTLAPKDTSRPNCFLHPSAVVDPGATIGSGSKIWHFSHIMPDAEIGEECNIGQNVYIGGQAKLGRNVKVQNNVSIYDRVEIDDDVFLGPSCVFTNVKTPRSHVSRKSEYEATIVQKGATIGANATIVCGTILREYCLVGAGAVVTKDVPRHAMVYGNPAKVHGWVSRSGAKLDKIPTPRWRKEREYMQWFQCSETREFYVLVANDASDETPMMLHYHEHERDALNGRVL